MKEDERRRCSAIPKEAEVKWALRKQIDAEP
jgi:hypothetical protein